MNKLTPHICQSPEWGEFKTKMGTPAIRAGNVQFTVHRLPKTPWSIGYCPRPEPEKINWQALYQAGRGQKCVFIKVEPNAADFKFQIPNFKLINSRPIFAGQTILLNLSHDEETLLQNMHPKTRYNIHLAARKGVTVAVSEREEDINTFLRIQRDTAQRQGFFVHPDSYYRTCFSMLHSKGMAYLLTAKVPPDSSTATQPIIATWLLFRYGETLYYPYGGSDYHYRNYMASSLLMWEAVKLGKQLGCRVFDMWGALDDPRDPWYGFTHFKLGFGGKLFKFAPTYDLVINPTLYPLVITADRVRWLLLKTLKKGQER